MFFSMHSLRCKMKVPGLRSRRVSKTKAMRRCKSCDGSMQRNSTLKVLPLSLPRWISGRNQRTPRRKKLCSVRWRSCRISIAHCAISSWVRCLSVAYGCGNVANAPCSMQVITDLAHSTAPLPSSSIREMSRPSIVHQWHC